MSKVGTNSLFLYSPNFIWYAVSFSFAFILLALAVIRIDFHADEAIYFANIPVNLSNDSGLLFHLIYLATGLGTPTPVSTRWASLTLGLVLIAASSRIVYRLVPESSRWMAAMTPLLLVISYQGVFSILRVRPEISWIAVSSLATCSLIELRFNRRWGWQVLLIVSLLLLPMNHMLSLFACAFLAGYLLMYGRFFVGFPLSCMAIMAMPIGLVLNRAVRSWFLTGHVEFVPPFGASLGGVRAPIGAFLWNVFWNAPNFLSDSAATHSWWGLFYSQANSSDGLHCLIANSLWGIALMAPLLFKRWEQRYVAAIPFFSLIAFYWSGYFNPTYAPLLAIFGLLIFIVVFANETEWTARKAIAGTVIGVSLFNGGSFLSTRVLNHGTATFFATESRLRASMAALPETTSIAVAERLQSVVPKHIRVKSILFKDAIPDDVDIVVVDHYDFEMYRFVPDYEKRRTEIENAITNMNVTERFVSPVYKRDKLFDRVIQNQSIASEQGSWFLRNSVDYQITVLQSSQSTNLAQLRTNESGERSRK